MAKRYTHVNDTLRKYAKDGQQVIEIGCGAKQYSIFPPSSSYLGIDLRADIYGGRGPNALADAQYLPFRDESADLIFVVAAFCLIENLDLALAEIRRVLRRHGRLLIFDYSKSTCRKIGAKHEFSSRSLADLLESRGFTSEIIRGFVPQRLPSFLHPIVKILPVGLVLHALGPWITVSGIKREGVQLRTS